MSWDKLAKKEKKTIEENEERSISHTLAP